MRALRGMVGYYYPGKEIAALAYLLFLLIILWQVYPDPPRLNDPEPTFDALFA